MSGQGCKKLIINSIARSQSLWWINCLTSDVEQYYKDNEDLRQGTWLQTNYPFVVIANEALMDAQTTTYGLSQLKLGRSFPPRFHVCTWKP